MSATAILRPEAIASATYVPSDTVAGRRYVVRDAETIDATCDCPDWLRRRVHTGEPCKHILRVRRALALIREAAALLGKAS